MKAITNLFKIEKKPLRGLMAIEWLTVAYLVFTLVIVLFAYTRVENPQAMIWGRVRIAAIRLLSHCPMMLCAVGKLKSWLR